MFYARLTHLTHLTLNPYDSPTMCDKEGGLALTSTEGRVLSSAGEKLCGLEGFTGGGRFRLL